MWASFISTYAFFGDTTEYDVDVSDGRLDPVWYSGRGLWSKINKNVYNKFHNMWAFYNFTTSEIGGYTYIYKTNIAIQRYCFKILTEF